MLVTVIGLFLSFILYAVILLTKKRKKLFSCLLIFLLCVSFISAFISFSQSIYIEKNFYNVNAIITFDEEGYPTTHFVNFYKNTSSGKFYKIENHCGFYVFREITLSEDVEPIIVGKHNPSQYYDGAPLYQYS